MANMHDCLQVAMDAGELDRDLGEAAQAELAELTERYRRVMPPDQADAQAAADLREATRRGVRGRRHMVVAELQARRRIEADLSSTPRPDLAIRNMIEFSEGSGFKGESLKSVASAAVKTVNGNLSKFVREAGLTVMGSTRAPALVHDIVRALHGDDVAGPAKAFAEGIAREQDRLRRLFNAYGGDIGKLENRGVRHTHDGKRIRAAGFAAWRDAIAPRLDWSKITDAKTGKPFAVSKDAKPFAEDIDRFLRSVHEGIVTDGWNRRTPSMMDRGQALYNRRAEARLLHFKSGADWLDYNAGFGSSDPYSAIMGDLHGLARDVAQMRVLGPNPKAMLTYAEQVATKRARVAGDVKMAEAVARQARTAKIMLSVFDGSANQTVHQFWSDFFSGVRAFNVATKLGSAILSSASDLVTLRAAAAQVGMNPNAVTLRAFKLIFSKSDRESLANAGFIADTLASTGAASSRLEGELNVPEWTRRISDFTMRATGLSFWTDTLRLAFHAEAMGELGRHIGTPLHALPEGLRRTLETRGIAAQDWDAIRHPDHLHQPQVGTAFLSPEHIRTSTVLGEAEAEGLAVRLQSIIEEAMERAIPVSSLEVQARVVGESDPGSIAGIVMRNGLQFKSYPVSLTMNIVRNLMAVEAPTRAARNGKRATKFAKLFTGLTLMGAMSIQLKEAAKGRDPRPMNDAKFWLAATLQGGSMGIFGDFMFAESSRAGGGLAETLAGPTVGLAADILRNTTGALRSEAEGDGVNLGRGVANFVRTNTPFLSSAWYARAAWDRIVADNLLRALDPEAEAYMARQEKRRARDFGNRTFWPRASVLPDRPPDLSALIGGRP